MGDSAHPAYYWVVSTFAIGQSNEMKVCANLSAAESTSNGYKTRIANVFPYQITQKADINVYYGSEYNANTEFENEEPIFTTSYSVQDYFLNRYEKSNDSKMKVLATAGLDYGANCQLYFDGKTYIINGSIYDYITAKENGLANATTNPSNAISANQPDEASYE